MATPPPGLEGFGPIQALTSGGSGEWMVLPPVKLYTISFIVKPGKVTPVDLDRGAFTDSEPIFCKILLGLKKRGFGKGKYNGFGGKVEPGESVEAAALRELKEEAGISAKLVQCGTFIYLHEGSDHTFQIEVFKADEYEGEPIETEEMRPEWFDVPDSVEQNSPIPWERMWADDRYWYPIMLSSKYFVGRVDFSESVEDGDEKYTLQRWWFGVRDT